MPFDVVALISALLSALAIFWTARNARKQRDHETQLRKKQEEFESTTSQAQRDHETQIRNKQEEFEQDLELLRGRLREVEAERDARRDYEYEARKRLYSEIQPLLFQLQELSESAYRWVMSLARTAQQDQLSWLSKGYFLSTTLYRFTAPWLSFD
jgi:DNA repair exonuclease SbcCD ATPase subunit